MNRYLLAQLYGMFFFAVTLAGVAAALHENTYWIFSLAGLAGLSYTRSSEQEALYAPRLEPTEPPLSRPNLEASYALAAGMVAQDIYRFIESHRQFRFQTITVATWHPLFSAATWRQLQQSDQRTAFPRQIPALVIDRDRSGIYGQCVILTHCMELYLCPITPCHTLCGDRDVAMGIIGYYPCWDERKTSFDLWLTYAEKIRRAVERVSREEERWEAAHK